MRAVFGPQLHFVRVIPITGWRGFGLTPSFLRRILMQIPLFPVCLGIALAPLATMAVLLRAPRPNRRGPRLRTYLIINGSLRRVR